MTLQDYATILRRSWIVIVTATAVGTLLALVMSVLATPVYQAQAQLFVSVKSANQVGEAYSGGLYVQQRVQSYVVVIDSPAVLEPALAELGLNIPYPDLAAKVSAQSPPNTVLLDVSATDPDPDQAARIANSVAASYATEIARLESSSPNTPSPSPTASPDNDGQTSDAPVQATVIKPALAGVKIAPRTGTNVLIGLILGLFVGVAIAILRHTLDTTIKTAEEAEQAAGATVLGAVAHDPEAQSNPLITLRDSPRAEAFRTIRTNLQYVDVDNPPKAVVITSSMPGEGKSTTACNLAIAIAQGGARVLLMEADLRRPKVAEYLQVDGSRGLTDVLVGRMPLPRSVIRWQRGLLDLLPAGSIPPNPSELLGSRHMAAVLSQLRTRYDMIIIDAPPLLPITDAAILSTVVDGAILVARYGVTRRDQLIEAAEALNQVNSRVLGTVINFVPLRRGRRYGYEYGYGYGPPSNRPEQVASTRPPRALPVGQVQAVPPIGPHQPRM